MKNPIVNISEDQNIITHESALQSKFSDIGMCSCGECCYNAHFNKSKLPCTLPCCSTERKDGRGGNFRIIIK